MSKLLVLPFALLACSPASAQGLFSLFPVSIPQECVVVAQRERMPTIINSKQEAVLAAFKLDQLNDKDPTVRQCKQTVARLKAML